MISGKIFYHTIHDSGRPVIYISDHLKNGAKGSLKNNVT